MDSMRSLRKRKSNQMRQPAPYTAKFSNNGSFCISCGEDPSIRLWDSSEGTLCHSFFTSGIGNRDICLAKDDFMLASCGDDGLVLYWDLAAQCLVRHFGGHAGGVNAVKFNQFGSVIVSADSCVRLWDLRSPTSDPIKIFDTFEDIVTSLCVKTTEIIAGSNDGSVQQFDIRNNKRFSHKFGSPVTCISVANAVEKSIIASCQDSTLKFCHVDTNGIRPVGEYKGHKCKSIKVGCCFTHGTTNVIGGSEDGHVFIWDTLSGVVASKSLAHSSAVTSVDCHPTNNRLISASMDGSVVLWRKAMDGCNVM